MTGSDPTVNGQMRQEGVSSDGMKERCIAFFDHHARLGWYLAISSGLNVLLNLLNLFH